MFRAISLFVFGLTSLVFVSVVPAVAALPTAPRLRRNMVMRCDLNETLFHPHAGANDTTTVAPVPHPSTHKATTTTTSPKTGALEWPGMPDPETAPPTGQPITASPPMGNQGGGLTTDDVPGEMPFGGGILSTPSFEKEAVDEGLDEGGLHTN